MTTQLITVLECFKNWNTENIYTLHTNKEQSIITKKPLQGSDKSKFSLSLRVVDTDATFSKIVNGSDKCISVKVASTETAAPMLLVNIKNVYDSWKTDKVGYFYQGKAIATIAFSVKSDKYQLTFVDNTKVIVDATVALNKIAPKKEETPTEAPAPAAPKKEETPTEAPAPAHKLTIDIVKELALQLPIADQATLVSQISVAIAAKLSNTIATLNQEAPTQTPAPITETSKEETASTETSAPRKTLDKEYPIHYWRLITWLENKYQGVEIKDILINWGDKEINGIKKATDQQVAKIASEIEGQEIGAATVREELATICYLEALNNGVLIEYLTKIGATVSEKLSKLSSSKQHDLHGSILRRWETKKIKFATLNNACKGYLKSNPELILQVMIGRAELPKK